VVVETQKIAALPRVPAVYVMYGGQPRWAAYVGVAGDPRERIGQHLNRPQIAVLVYFSLIVIEPRFAYSIGIGQVWRDRAEPSVGGNGPARIPAGE
jgi:hypothetical protein